MPGASLAERLPLWMGERFPDVSVYRTTGSRIVRSCRPEGGGRQGGGMPRLHSIAG
jgi:hypothetical protein